MDLTPDDERVIDVTGALPEGKPIRYWADRGQMVYHYLKDGQLWKISTPDDSSSMNSRIPWWARAD